MEENKIMSNKNCFNEENTNSENLILNLLENYSYDEIINYLFDEDNKIVNENLKNKLKELVEKIDIEELSRLLTKEEINKIIEAQKLKNKGILKVVDNEPIITKNDLKINDNSNKNYKIKSKRKSFGKQNKKISKIIYRKNNDSIYIFRYVTSKKDDAYLLRCQDKHCQSKASYNMRTKELLIYEKHSIDMQNHIYLSDRTQNSIKELISFMNQNKDVLSLEIFDDNSKKIINNITETYCSKLEHENIINMNLNLLLNKKRYIMPTRFEISRKLDTIKFNSNKSNIKKKKKRFFKVKHSKNDVDKNNIKFDDIKQIEHHDLNLNEIINLNEEEKIDSIELEDNEELINKKENYCEIKDKYIKHNFLLTEIEQICFGKNKRLGTHFHKENNGNIYNYFGNNKEIKDFNMNYRCILKGCKGKGIYNLKSRTFTILIEHSRPYEEHYCSNPNDKNTKKFVDYLKKNDNLSDLQIILI